MIKNALKRLATLFMSFMFLLMSNVFVAKAVTEESDVHDVKIAVSFPEDTYTVGGNDTTATITFTNNNPYEINVNTKDGSLLQSTYFVAGEDDIPDTITLAAKGNDDCSKSYNVPLSYTFRQFKEVSFNNFKNGNQVETLKVGLVASYNAVPYGSQFNVDCFDASESNHAEYFKLLDNSNNVDHAAFFDLSLNNGEKQLRGYAKVYIQIPIGWDAHELQASFIAPGADEQFVEQIEMLDGVKYLVFTTNHFSPYALTDPKNPTTPTGDTSMKIILPLVISAVLFLILCLVLGRKRRSSLLAVILCVGLGFGTLVVCVADEIKTASSGAKADGTTVHTTVIDHTADLGTQEVDASASFATDMRVFYDGPTLGNQIVDYDEYEYAYDYFTGPFTIEIKGGPAGWVGKLQLVGSNGTLKKDFAVDFSTLTADANGTRLFSFDPEYGSSPVNEIDFGDKLILVDNFGYECDRVTLVQNADAEYEAKIVQDQ